VNSFPERFDVRGAVQLEQRVPQPRIDYQLSLFDKPAVSPHLPPLPAPAIRKKTNFIAELFNKSLNENWNQSYLATAK
jgi:hypothetical protein